MLNDVYTGRSEYTNYDRTSTYAQAIEAALRRGFIFDFNALGYQGSYIQGYKAQLTTKGEAVRESENALIVIGGLGEPREDP
jgi:hypothetical protein